MSEELKPTEEAVDNEPSTSVSEILRIVREELKKLEDI